MYTKFEYTVDGVKHSATKLTNSVLAFRAVVTDLVKVADVGSIRATSF